MAKIKKEFIKDILVTNINNIISNKDKYFCITYKLKFQYIDYVTLTTMSLSTILELIDKKQIYIAKIIIKESSKKQIVKKEISNSKLSNSKVSNCKSSLNDIYG